MEFVFSNSLIMDLICQNLSLRDVKNLRLTNSGMNMMMLSELSKRSKFVIKSLSLESGFVDKRYLKCNPALIKNIEICDAQLIEIDPRSISVPVVGFFEEYHGLIESLNIYTTTNSAPLFMTIVNKFKFQNIKMLMISDNPTRRQYTSVNRWPMCIGKFQNLTFLKIKSENDSAFMPMFEAAINGSGKQLQTLEMMSNFCPDLFKSTSLKKLVYEFSPRMDTNTNCRGQQFSQMLEQVKKSLEELEVWTQRYGIYALNLPTNCPKLKVFKNLAVNALHFSLSSNQLPQLNSISLGCHQDFQSMEKMNVCLDGSTPVPTVTELNLMSKGSIAFISKCQEIFPNVKELTIPLNSNDHIDFSLYFQTVWRGWNIEKLKLNLQTENYIDFFNFMSNIPMTGLKVLQLCSTNPKMRRNLNNPLEENVQASILKTAKLEQFIVNIAYIRPYSKNILKEFAKQNKLPLGISLG